MDFVLDYSLTRRSWKKIYCAPSRTFFLFWLLTTHATGVASKQLEIPKLPLRHLLPKPSFSFSKFSGLSVVPPAALLNGKQFIVEPVTTRNVTTQIGQTTYLHCIVDKLEDKTVGGLQRQVSWIRLRDFHLLTVGLYTYTSDSRFQTIYNEYATDWTLQIRYPQLSDEGLYECQVSSDPPASHYVYLKVLVPKTKILGGGDFYVNVGSELNLTCVITDCPEPPAFVFWYRDSRMINYDTARGDITVQKAGNDTAISRLRIKNAQTSDSGNYSCCPSNADAASIFVHVLKGEKHAAVQNDAASTSKSTRFAPYVGLLIVFQLIFLTVVRICAR
ncbi:zwei Ig domain protein zig-8-like [Uloborus diversus]|uniref:zwei Ig domain protein zig-8-like n=1 Tax=Uloborus diversus TaxID=327109 RepID=UPI00240958C2|nr:zwei Ig domain protein zig-8-like [Uloborus diversus]